MRKTKVIILKVITNPAPLFDPLHPPHPPPRPPPLTPPPPSPLQKNGIPLNFDFFDDLRHFLSLIKLHLPPKDDIKKTLIAFELVDKQSNSEILTALSAFGQVPSPH